MYYYERYKEIKDKSDIESGKLRRENNVYIVNNKEVINNRGIINDVVYIEDNRIINIKERNVQKIAGILYMNKNEKQIRKLSLSLHKNMVEIVKI